MVHADPDAEALLRLLPYGQWNVAGGREVLDALLALGERAVGALARALADPARPRLLRLAAAWILGRVGSADARDALRPALADLDPAVAGAAGRALGLAPGAPAAA